jgi:hypothetical protein
MMTEILKHQSMRLQGYDYTQSGGYFLPFHTWGWIYLFGQIVDDEMIMNDLGRIVQRTWLGLLDHYAGIDLDEFIVMPNHFHGIIFVNGMIKTRSSLKTSLLVGAGFRRAFQEECAETPEAISHQG